MFYPCHGIPQQRSSARSSQSGMPAADCLSTFFAHNLGYPLIHCFSNADGQRPTDSLNVLREDTHPHKFSHQWKQKDSHLKATICGRFAIPRKTKTAICGRPDRFQASKDPNQYPLDEIFLGRLPHITEIIFLKCQKLPHIGHFKLKTRHRHITFFVRSKTAFRKRHHHRRRGYRFCGGRVRAAIRRVPYRRAHGCRDATACAFRPPPR